MTEQLFRVGTTEWWIVADTVKETIISQHKKSDVEATIAILEQQLAEMPNPSTDEYAYGVIQQLVANSGLTAGEKAYGKDLLERMWQSFSSDTTMSDVLAMKARLDAEKQLLAKMV